MRRSVVKVIALDGLRGRAGRAEMLISQEVVATADSRYELVGMAVSNDLLFLHFKQEPSQGDATPPWMLP